MAEHDMCEHLRKAYYALFEAKVHVAPTRFVAGELPTGTGVIMKCKTCDLYLAAPSLGVE